jgi:hypothetical protein
MRKLYNYIKKVLQCLLNLKEKKVKMLQQCIIILVLYTKQWEATIKPCSTIKNLKN